MTPHYADDWLTVYHGDARSVLAELPAESVHCVVTSPPYWGLRDYGTASWEGGDEGCDHIERLDLRRDTSSAESDGFRDVRGEQPRNRKELTYRSVCGKCGARRIDSQLGLEPTPEQYVENMVAVFREVRRVLRSDGTVWLNLGDSYASGGERATGRNDTDRETPGGRGGSFRGGDRRTTGQRDGLKPKDLVGIPWRVAFALQADGWYLRSDIIWSKPNPMPESVTDRPTKSHEYLFLLSKAARYYYDADAVREATDPWAANHPDSWATSLDGGHDVVRWSQRAEKDATTYGTGEMRSGRNLRSVWSIATAPYPGAHFATFPPKLVEPCIKPGTSERGVCPECGAPWVRVVRATNTPRDMDRPQARRAVELAEAAGLTDGHLAAIRATGVTDSGKAQVTQDGFGKNTADVIELAAEAKQALGGYYREFLLTEPGTVGWRPVCPHYPRTSDWQDVPPRRPGEDPGEYSERIAPVLALQDELVASWRPSVATSATVLDPFAGSGTTGMVAQSLSRRAVLIDLSMDYLGQLMERNRHVPLGI